ncbi:fumarylacetoacetate hydrolase family protein [Paracraurococcus ruber]|uniref:Fumarylacetoacetase-like C-terminal domain-containing protein n=1 Tax=Paracraurococcus ruber TaxID=77675 RepID=A0ABS1CWW2_9PROT|nr:hypothetical protein [Paracraurococcus ruber]TDG29449.1 hypothetical protein E2C05_17740 [Paracraurococcus ruber]
MPPRPLRPGGQGRPRRSPSVRAAKSASRPGRRGLGCLRCQLSALRTGGARSGAYGRLWRATTPWSTSGGTTLAGPGTRARPSTASAPLGPWLATSDEASDPRVLAVETDLNGKAMQRGDTRTLAFGVAKLVSSVSRCFAPQPGDVICTGRPPGVGNGRKPSVFLSPGHTVRLAVAGLGEQRQHVVAVRWSPASVLLARCIASGPATTGREHGWIGGGTPPAQENLRPVERGLRVDTACPLGPPVTPSLGMCLGGSGEKRMRSAHVAKSGSTCSSQDGVSAGTLDPCGRPYDGRLGGHQGIRRHSQGLAWRRASSQHRPFAHLPSLRTR